MGHYNVLLYFTVYIDQVQVPLKNRHAPYQIPRSPQNFSGQQQASGQGMMQQSGSSPCQPRSSPLSPLQGHGQGLTSPAGAVPSPCSNNAVCSPVPSSPGKH